MWRRSFCASSMLFRNQQCSVTPGMPKVAFTAPTWGGAGQGGRHL